MKGIKILLTTLAVMAMFARPVDASEGMITIQSAHDVMTTTDRFKQVISKKISNVLGMLAHAAGKQD